MTDKKEMLCKVRKKAKLMRENHAGCAESTFLAIAETLGLKGRHSVAVAMVGMSGGIANFGTGSCGAIAGAAAAISLFYNFLPSRCEEEQQYRQELFDSIGHVVLKFKKKYGNLSCREVLMSIFGKSFDFKNNERLKEYKMMDKSNIEVIEDTSAWALEVIMEMKSKKNSIVKRKIQINNS